MQVYSQSVQYRIVMQLITLRSVVPVQSIVLYCHAQYNTFGSRSECKFLSSYIKKDKDRGTSSSSHPPLPYNLVEKMGKLQYSLNCSKCWITVYVRFSMRGIVVRVELQYAWNHSKSWVTVCVFRELVWTDCEVVSSYPTSQWWLRAKA